MRKRSRNLIFSSTIIIILLTLSLATATPTIDVDWIFPTQDINVSQNSFFNISVVVGCQGGDCGEINVSLDPERGTEYAFTTCGQTGKSGPTQSSCDTNYTGTSLEGAVTVDAGIQSWTVPASGLYNVTIAGAAGGKGTSDTTGTPGNGIILNDLVTLIQGQTLKVLVGQKGEGYGGLSGAGGGGSFVVNSSDGPVIIAGGGSGTCNSATGQDGQNTTSGGGISPGTAGSGGGTGNGGGGGGGLLTSGTNGNYGPGGTSFLLGGVGGNNYGGFGGGGGQTNSGSNIAGGGGGYSGGSGNTESTCVNAGGGGSYNATADFTVLGTNSENGYVTFEYLGSLKGGLVSTTEGTTPFYTNVSNPYTVNLNDGESQTITWWVNATGSIDIKNLFYAYANLTSDNTVSNITSKLNITIIDTTAPQATVLYPSESTYNSMISEINYSYSDMNAGYCWYSLDDGTTNSTAVSAGTNFTGVEFSAGTNNLILYCNDSSGNSVSDSATFDIDIPAIGLELTYPSSSVNVTQNQTFQVQATVTCLNTNCGAINVSLDPASSSIVLDDLESGEGEWTHGITATRDEWEYGAPSYGPSAAHSGENVWGTNLDSSYAYSGGRYWLASPNFSLSGYENSTLSFWQWYQTETSYDGGIVEITNDSGVTWTKITPEGGYPGSGYSGAPWSNDDYAGSTGDWVLATFDISEYDDDELVQVRFHFAADGSVSYAGWYIDDFNITGIGGSKGVISMNTSATPFYTTTQNPYNVTLNEGESQTITWSVNATGDSNQTYEFFAFANLTSNESIGNITSKWNVTIVDFETCASTWENTTWSDWQDQTTCRANDTILQNRSLTQYDTSDCGALNVTFWEYQEIACDYCTPSLTNTSWSDWTNQSTCSLTDLQQQNRTLTQYDENSCGEVENSTFVEYQNISCNFCSYSLANTSWSDWTNLSCLSDDTRNQSRSLTQYDENYSTCYTLTGLPSDLWNSGENQTLYEYQNELFCNYSIVGDEDSDGIPNENDTLISNESNVTKTGIENLNITIGGNTTDNTFEDAQTVLFYDAGSLMLNFTHNFTQANLDLRKVSLIKNDNYLVINLSNQLQGNKTIYLPNNDFVSLCVKDAEVSSIDDVSSSCDGSDEYDFTQCLQGNYSTEGINCTYNNSIFEITNLAHSAIRGTPEETTTETPSGGTTGGGGGGGGGSTSKTIYDICTPNWNCDSWSFCSKEFTQQRICLDLNNCNITLDKPSELRTCPDILFDSLVEIQTKKVYPWTDLKFDVNLKEVTQFDLVDIKVLYQISLNQKIVYEESETKAIQEELSYEKTIEDLDLSPGEYSLYVVVDYGKNQTSSSEQNFNVVGSSNVIIYSLILLFIIILSYGFYKSRKHEEEIEEKLEEIEEKIEDKCPEVKKEISEEKPEEQKETKPKKSVVWKIRKSAEEIIADVLAECKKIKESKILKKEKPEEKAKTSAETAILERLKKGTEEKPEEFYKETIEEPEPEQNNISEIDEKIEETQTKKKTGIIQDSNDLLDDLK